MAQPSSPTRPVDPDPDPGSTEPLRPPGSDPFLGSLAPPPWPDRVRELVASRLPWSPARSAATVALVAVVLVVAWWSLRPPAAPLESSIPMAGSSAGSGPSAEGTGPAPVAAATSTTVVTTEVVVQAAGPVARPGVFRLPTDARVDDLVREAGGLTEDADADRVNLAAPLADGERVWVPRVGEVATPEVVAGTGGGGGGGGGPGAGDGGGAATPAVVDLNTATAEDLDTLPGVGPATATAILAYRDEHGSFSSVDELLEVRGIGDAKLEQLRSLVRV